MKLRFLIIYIVLLLGVGAFGCYKISSGYFTNEIPTHTTDINRCLVRLEKNWDDISGEKEKLIDRDEEFDYAVLDNDSNLLIYTREDMSRSISSATSNYDIIRDIEIVEGSLEEDGGAVRKKVVGKLIVRNPKKDQEQKMNRKIAAFLAIIIALTAVVFILYYIYLRVRVVAPFNKLKKFASRIASGDLDTPLEMDRGHVFGAFTESFDIMREELKASREREEAAVKSRKELVAELSHDIKTPVASIKAMADVMSLNAKDDMERDTIASINSKADQIDNLISNLFHATLEELEQLEVKAEELNSTDIVQMVKEADYLNKVETLDIKEVVVWADRLRLNQVISNIISNSYKYANTEINVKSFFEKASSDYLVIEISDKGGGVPEEELELITQKFKRGSNTSGKDGSGLGLYISGYLMEKMEGSLACRNGDGGFVVSIRIKVV